MVRGVYWTVTAGNPTVKFLETKTRAVAFCRDIKSNRTNKRANEEEKKWGARWMEEHLD